ncbi:Oxysterol-binding protein-like protein 1 [Saitozyma sp. JCM 24511]|nr:Oxysterol-binding protein-like protein 1 [Saitozyma sp. JCM 24511]
MSLTLADTLLPHAALQTFTDETGAPATLPEVGGGGEEGKLKVLLGLLKKLVGVKDVANLRLSLPASLLEPIPNLEYWQYADRADIFAAIGDSHDELERMLAVLRFSFSKELKFVRARLGKPYNSALGEHFRCSWRLPPIMLDSKTSEPIVRTHIHVPIPGEPAYGGQNNSGWTTPVLRPEEGGRAMSETSSIRSESSKASKKPAMRKSASREKVFDLSALSRAIPGPGDEIEGDPDSGVVESEKVTVVFLCEQVSHHPPISAAYYCCPERGIEAVGMDQIVARVSGMSVKLGPGPINKGIFVRINREGPGKGEEYQITHPSAQVNGIIKGAYYGTISDQISVTCRGGDGKVKLRTLLDYKDESWIGKPRFLFDGVIYKYEEGNIEHEAWSKAKHVPADRVVAHLEGNWMKEVRYRLKGEKDWRILLDLDQLALIPKMVRPLEEQESSESRKLWDPVTQMLLSKNWGEATRQKQVIEQRQRDAAVKRKAANEEYLPRFFETEWENGRPVLSEAGKKAIEEEHQRVNGGVTASGAEPSGTPTPVASSASSQVRV